jgi:hypothetical protein
LEEKNVITYSGNIIQGRRGTGNMGYIGEEVQAYIPAGAKNRIHEKGKRNKALTKGQERENKAKSHHIRARVEICLALNQFAIETMKRTGSFLMILLPITQKI